MIENAEPVFIADTLCADIAKGVHWANIRSGSLAALRVAACRKPEWKHGKQQRATSRTLGLLQKNVPLYGRENDLYVFRCG